MEKSNVDNKNIIIIDDEPGICALCQRVLAEEGFVVDITMNAKSAQALVKTKQYTLCLLDIKMPGMSGMELYQWLRKKLPQLADRVVFSTGSLVNEFTLGLVEQSGRPLLPKPFTTEELKTTVKQTLEELEVCRKN